MNRQLGEERPCTTADEVIPGSEDRKLYTVTHRLEDREKDRLDDQIICECELMNRSMFVRLLKEQPNATFDDLRRQLRLGMGPCQGGFCATRAAGLACSEQVDDTERASGLLRLFLKHFDFLWFWQCIGLLVYLLRDARQRRRDRVLPLLRSGCDSGQGKGSPP